MFARRQKVHYTYVVFLEGQDISQGREVDWDFENEDIPCKGDIFFPLETDHYYVVDSRQYNQGKYNVSCTIYIEKKRCEIG